MINNDLTNIIQVVDIYKQGVTLTANAETTVSFATEIADATPIGYKFIGLTFCGAYPNDTWHYTSVTPCALNVAPNSIKFTTSATQPYNLCMLGIFIRDI